MKDVRLHDPNFTSNPNFMRRRNAAEIALDNAGPSSIAISRSVQPIETISLFDNANSNPHSAHPFDPTENDDNGDDYDPNNQSPPGQA